MTDGFLYGLGLINIIIGCFTFSTIFIKPFVILFILSVVMIILGSILIGLSINER